MSAASGSPVLLLKRGEDRRLRAGHLWVFSNEIDVARTPLTSFAPGDAVIVPSQLDYETWGRALVRNLKDWSQIFYQFGLGAAAIVTLRNN